MLSTESKIKIPYRISALILAAGYSSRMDRFKPLAPLGGIPIIEHTCRIYRAAGINDIVVVTGNRSGELQEAMKHLDVRWTENTRFHEGMFTSVLTGIRQLEKCDAFFLTPVDIPLVRPDTVKQIMSCFPSAGNVIIPVYRGTDGHPPLISASLIPEILDHDGAGGLGGLLRKSGNILRLPVADEGILMDCDLPEDYRKLLEVFENKKYLSRDECMELLISVHHVEKWIVAHCEKVASLAVFLARSLEMSSLEIGRIECAAMLHDIARKEPRHAEAGAEILSAMNFHDVADIIRKHMDISIENEIGKAEAPEIVFLADKLVSENSLQNLEERFNDKILEFGADSEAGIAARRRLESAMKIRLKIEKQTGRDFSSLLGEYGRDQ
jgi:CTP:molybdopterin cytidylyltransferase MocA/HD superfamily phosphodiesterase